MTILGLHSIDFSARKPYRNTKGRLWGSTRFMAPEELERDAFIDERTNVFTMGAMAFCMLGSDRERTFDLRDETREQYQLAIQAVSPKRE